MGAKSSVKLAYKMFLAPIFTSDGHPMLLVWLKTTQEDAPSEQLLINKDIVTVTRYFT